MKFTKVAPWLIWMMALPVFGQSLVELERKAAGGDVGSMLRVAMRYYEGEGIGKNPVQAYQWFRMAAEKGDTEGMFALGLMHTRGIGAQQSSNEAARWTLKAAELGHAHSQYVVSVFYRTGNGIIKSFPDSIKWLSSAAMSGHEGAQMALAQHYRKGDIVAQDLVQSYAWFNIADSTGAANASVNREIVAGLLSGAQLTQAQTLSSQIYQKVSKTPPPLPQIIANIDPNRRSTSSTSLKELSNHEPPLNRLVAYYPFDGDVKDYSGNDRHGEIKGRAAFLPGINGKDNSACYLANRSWIYFPPSDIHLIDFHTKEFTISAWVKYYKGQLFGEYFQAGTGIRAQISVNHENGNVGMGFYPSSHDTPNKGNRVSFKPESPPHKKDGWYLVQLRKHNEPNRFYTIAINGKVEAKIDKPDSFAGKKVRAPAKAAIGTHANTPGRYATGTIDELRIYDVALPDKSLEYLYSENNSQLSQITISAKRINRSDSTLRQYNPFPGRNFTIPGLELEMIWIPAGKFMMGSPASEPDRQGDETPHEVTLTKGFWLAKYELTQKQYAALMGKNPSKFKGENRPVETVSWIDAVAFCRKLGESTYVKGNVPFGYQYKLPTEAQWEYACRAGTTTAFHFGATLQQGQANFNRHDNKTQPVGSYPANEWGLHDMHGNVWEWCSDWIGNYPSVRVTDPEGPSRSAYRVIRGGSWHHYGRYCRSATRLHLTPGNKSRIVGFRPSLRSE